MTILTLYMKPGCHLCADAGELLTRLGPEYSFIFREIDITQDPDLKERYGDTIPVVELDGRELLTTFISEANARKALERALKAAR